jgi:hypothetical protein
VRDQQEPRGRERGSQRAARTAQAWDERWPGRETVRTSHGEVVLERVQYRTDPDSGVAYVDVTVAGPAGGDPHFRVVNPPLLVQDPEGEHVAHGVRWREDPLAALAEVIGSNGGAQAQKRRHGR